MKKKYLGFEFCVCGWRHKWCKLLDILAQVTWPWAWLLD